MFILHLLGLCLFFSILPDSLTIPSISRQSKQFYRHRTDTGNIGIDFLFACAPKSIAHILCVVCVRPSMCDCFNGHCASWMMHGTGRNDQRMKRLEKKKIGRCERQIKHTVVADEMTTK